MLSKLNDCFWAHYFSYSKDNYKGKYKWGRFFEMQKVTKEISCMKIQGILYDFIAKRNRIP